LPEDEKPPTRAELGKILKWARLAAADPTKGVAVDQIDQRTVRRICNPLRLGELIDHRYVLNGSTCWWSNHLAQYAAREDYTKHFPVHVLRKLLDHPEARGFDRDLQNLIIAVFAEEQQLAWYQHGAAYSVDTLQAISDQLELRQIDLPAAEVWDKARKHAGGIFGVPKLEWLSAASVASMAQAVRGRSGQYKAVTAAMVGHLKQRAEVLGLDPSSDRLAHAEQAVQLLDKLSVESDNAVLVELMAAIDFDIDDAAVGAIFGSAETLSRALLDTPWNLLAAVSQRAANGDAAAQTVLDDLHDKARHDAIAADLPAALRAAVDRATELLVVVPPPPAVVTPPIPIDGNGGNSDPGGTKSTTGHSPDDGRVGVSAVQRRIVRTEADLDEVIKSLRERLANKQIVSVSWVEQ
jgi:hypothetical protein